MMSVHTKFRFSSFALTAASMLAAVVTSPAVAAVDVVKIGVITATGAGTASVAEALGAGAQSAIDAFNKKNPNLQLKRVDVNIGPNDPATAMNSFRMAVSRDDVLTIVSMGSGVMGAVRPILDQNKLVGFSFASSDSLIKNHNSIQQVAPFWGDEISALGKFLCSAEGKSQRPNRVAMLAVGGTAGDSAVAAMKKWKGLCGIELVDVQRYSIPTTVFKPQLSALAQENPDAIYIASLGGPENTAIVVQTRQLGITARFLSPISGPEQSLFDLDGSDGFIYTGFSAKNLPAEVEGAYRKYGAVAVMGYYYGAVTGDVVEQMKKTNTDITRENFRVALLKQRRFNVGDAVICFEDDGHTKMPLSVWKIQDKKPVELATVVDETCR
jgi:ABC-type branched-subunit amino acid transport system substrate-binding protein